MGYRHISVSLVDDVTVVRFENLAKAVFTEDEIDEIGNELQVLVDQIQPCSLVLDFENKEFVCFARFDGKLVRLQRMVTQRNGILRLCHLPPTVLQLFKINRLAEYFSLCSSLETALAACAYTKVFESDASGNKS
jgi:hypothetical protein